MVKDQELKPILEDQKVKNARGTGLDQSSSSSSAVSSTTNGDSVSPQLDQDNVAPKEQWSVCVNAKSYCGSQWSHIILTCLTVLGAAIALITWPICMAGLHRVGSDGYPVVYMAAFFNTCFYLIISIPTKYLCKSSDKPWSYRPASVMSVIVLGLCNLTVVILQTFSGMPSRTPAQLQVALSTLLIPITVMGRFLFFKEGIQRRQWACIGVVMIGLLLILIPQFITFDGFLNIDHTFEINDTLVLEEREELALPLYARIIWPMTFALSILPMACTMVLAEKYLTVPKENPLVLSIYIQLVTFIGGLVLFWTDIIPGWGMAKDIEHFWHHQSRAFQCMFGYGDTCHMLTSRLWMFFFSSASSFILQMLLIRYAQGAIYSVLVLALVLPMGNMFWALIHDNWHYGKLIWDPQFEINTLFSFSGLLILIPPVALYDYFGTQDRTKGFNRM